MMPKKTKTSRKGRPTTTTIRQGRTTCTPDVMEKILGVLRIGCTRTAAAVTAGVNELMFSHWMNDDAYDKSPWREFRVAVAEAEAQAEVMYAKVIAKASHVHHEGQWQAAAWWLERRKSREWARTEPRFVDDRAPVAPASPAPIVLVVTQPGDTLDDIKARVASAAKG